MWEITPEIRQAIATFLGVEAEHVVSVKPVAYSVEIAVPDPNRVFPPTFRYYHMEIS